MPAADIFGSAARVLVELTLTPELAKIRLAWHGIFHGIGQKECGGILQNPVGFRLIVNKQLSIVVEDFGKEYRFGVKAAVGNGSEGRGQLQVGHTFCDAAQRR